MFNVELNLIRLEVKRFFFFNNYKLNQKNSSIIIDEFFDLKERCLGFYQNPFSFCREV